MPPRRAPRGAPEKKEEKKEEANPESRVREYEEKIDRLERTVEQQRGEINNLKGLVQNLDGVDSRLAAMQAKMDAITGVYDDLHEKMHEIDKTRRNNLMIHGVKPDFGPENPQALERKVQELIRFTLGISREIPVTKVTRLLTGPEVRGFQPVVVNFVSWRDREEVLRNAANKLRGTNIYITEDMSKKMREHRHELQKYARQVRSRSPAKKVTIRSDKLFVDNVMYCYDDDKHEVVRWNRPPSPPRPGSRNYSSVDNIMRRANSMHSVNGEAGNGTYSPDHQRPVASAQSGKYASSETLMPPPPPQSSGSGGAQQHQNHNNHQSIESLDNADTNGTSTKPENEETKNPVKEATVEKEVVKEPEIKKEVKLGPVEVEENKIKN